MTEVKDFYIKVWKFRTLVDQSWPTPDQDDSWRFAYCEAGEALDEWMRFKTQYKRNNDEAKSNPEKLLDELADLAMMLLTALGPDKSIYRPQITSELDLDEICRLVGNAWHHYTMRRRNQHIWVAHVITLIDAIAVYPGMDLDERLNARLTKIYRKHVSAEGGLPELLLR